MKKYLYCLLVLALLAGAACAAPTSPPQPAAPPEETAAPPAPPEFSRPTFLLSELPALTPYAPPPEIVRRYYAAPFVDTLQAAADYGRLYPYEGKITGSGWWASKTTYGLVDSQGRIVVDPVYRSAWYTENGAYLCLSYPVAGDDAAAQELLRSSEGSVQRSRYIFASADGTWVSGEFYGDGAGLIEDRVIVRFYSGDMQDYWSGAGQSFSIYNLEGHLLAEHEGNWQGFNEGRGLVHHTVFDERTHSTSEYYSSIDKDGNVLEEKVLYENIYTYHEKYTRFETGGDNPLCGLKDSDGNIVVPAEYNWISLPNDEDSILAVGEKINGIVNSYWLVDLASGQGRQIKLAGATVTSVSMVGNGWCVADFAGGLALLKGEKEYRFDTKELGYRSVYCRWIEDDLFALEYEKLDKNERTVYSLDIFDAAGGKVLKSFNGYHYNYTLNNTLPVLYKPDSYGERQLVLNRAFEPAFSPEILGGFSTVNNIYHVADDVYSVRTTLYSGLIRENGEWLVRLYVNNLD